MIENREKSWFRRTDALIAAFIVPVLIMVIIYVERGIFPFGNRTYLRTDLYHQYAPFMSEFQYKLNHGGSLLYSWDVGMGVNFSALYAYYLASPLNWLVAFAPKAYLIEFINIMIILKTGLAGLTMTIYLGKHTKNSTFSPALFGIFYALSGYMAAYSWNIMWLDCIVLFPLICLGLEKLVNEKRGLLYAVTLAISILSNYYISIMICIFMVLYFIALLILKGKQSFGSFIGTAAMFAGYSLLAGALAAAVWLPEIYALKYTASEDMTFPKVISEYFSIIDELSRHMMNVATEQTLDHWPNVYCGVAVFPLVLLFIANREISLKEKIVYSVLALIFLASFSLNILSFIWHGLHYPNSLPSRQSFIYIWLILFMCYRAVDQISGVKAKDIAIAALVSFGFIFLCQTVVKDDAFTWSVWYLTLGFVALYCLIIYLYRTGKMGVNLATFVLIGICAIEAAVNMTNTGISTTSRDQYIENNDATRAVVAYVEDDRDFYRFEKTDRKAKDDGAWMNFHTVSLFSSMAHEDISTLYRQLGCESSTNAYCITGSTPLVDALFDIKYSIYTGYNDNPHDKIICGCDDIKLYQNEYCLPLGFMIPDGLENKWVMEAGSPILVQNQMATSLGAGKVLNQVDGFTEGSAYTFTVPEDGLYYGYSDNSATKEMKVTIGDKEETFEKVDRGYLIELGWLPKNTIVYFEATDDTATMVHAYRFDYDALGQMMEQLDAQPMQVNTYDDTHIYAGVDVTEAGILATTIPYDPGWTVKVDGNVVTPGKFLDSFISLQLTGGHHDIEFTYMPEGLKLGTMVSAAALAALLIIIIITLIVDGVHRRRAVAESDENSAGDIVADSEGADDDGTAGDEAGSDDNSKKEDAHEAPTAKSGGRTDDSETADYGAGTDTENTTESAHSGDTSVNTSESEATLAIASATAAAAEVISVQPQSETQQQPQAEVQPQITLEAVQSEQTQVEHVQPEQAQAEHVQPKQARPEHVQPTKTNAGKVTAAEISMMAKREAEEEKFFDPAEHSRSRKRRRNGDSTEYAEEIIIKKNDDKNT